MAICSSANGAACPIPHEVESRLLLHVIETLQQSPGMHRVEAQLLVHEAGVVARPFVEQGFQRHPRLFMVLPLDQHAQATHRRWTLKSRSGAGQSRTTSRPRLHHHRLSRPRGLGDQRSIPYLSGSLRFLNNIVRFPGCGTFDAEASFVAVHKRARSLVGLILCSRVRHDVGHVTQVCVLPEYRSHGLGESLIAATAANLRQRNFSMLSLTVTEANARAVELYQRWDSRSSACSMRLCGKGEEQLLAAGLELSSTWLVSAEFVQECSAGVEHSEQN